MPESQSPPMTSTLPPDLSEQLRLTKTKRDALAIVYQSCYHTRSEKDKGPKTDRDESADFICGWRGRWRGKPDEKCTGRIRVNLSTQPPQLIKAWPHRHPGDEARCRAHILRSDLNEQVIAKPHISVKRVYKEQLGQAETNDEAALFASASVSRQLERKRRRFKSSMEIQSAVEILLANEPTNSSPDTSDLVESEMTATGKALNEGKTKVIYEIPSRPGHVLISSKDSITAGDGAKRDTMEGKSVVSNQTASMIFQYLKTVGIYNHFVEDNDEKSFVARNCHMIPLEFVTRRIATGSFLKRNPGVPEGFVFAPPKLETFFKDDANHDPQWSSEQIISAKLTYETKKGTVVITRDKLTLLLEQTKTIFEILERAWRSKDCVLVDMKIEFGVDVETGDIFLADMIDSDSWRLWPHGDRKQMKDKQVYREMTEVTETGLKTVKANFEWIADQLKAIFAYKTTARAVIFMGSGSDLEYAKKIATEVEKFGITAILRVSSAHKTTEDTLAKAAAFEADGVPTVFVAVAGRSNGLGPVLSGNMASPVINCPPPSDYIAQDIWSSLRLPTGLGCTTVLSPDAAGLAVANIIGLTDYAVWARLKARLYNQKATIIKANEDVEKAKQEIAR